MYRDDRNALSARKEALDGEIKRLQDERDDAARLLDTLPMEAPPTKRAPMALLLVLLVAIGIGGIGVVVTVRSNSSASVPDDAAVADAEVAEPDAREAIAPATVSECKLLELVMNDIDQCPALTKAKRAAILRRIESSVRSALPKWGDAPTVYTIAATCSAATKVLVVTTPDCPIDLESHRQRLAAQPDVPERPGLFTEAPTAPPAEEASSAQSSTECKVFAAAAEQLRTCEKMSEVERVSGLDSIVRLVTMERSLATRDREWTRDEEVAACESATEMVVDLSKCPINVAKLRTSIEKRAERAKQGR
jgi:hypothetical protein